MNRNSWKKQGNWRRSRKEIKSISWIERGTIEKNNFINSQISAKIKVNCIIKYFYKIINKSAKVNSYRKFHFLVHFPLQRDCKQYCSAVSTNVSLKSSAICWMPDMRQQFGWTSKDLLGLFSNWIRMYSTLKFTINASIAELNNILSVN